MLFRRYEEVILRLEELGTRMGKLCNSERQELQSLLEEQAWLGLTLVKKARSLMEDIDKNFESLFDWMVLSSDLIDRAAEQGGRPDDVLRLKLVMSEAGSLREQLKKLSINNNIADNNDRKGDEDAKANDLTVGLETKTTSLEVEAVFEAAAALEPVEVISAVPAQQVKVKKVRKKKAKVKKRANAYAPPSELLTSISRRMVPTVRRYVDLPELNPAVSKIIQPRQE
ncbi:hypothetical protein SAMN05660649_01169 [Desulfotomaculum arcticum]|uniref:Uncharacterized protein n=1 Tax=Desulfotruncus arcticus DSM 17038 TaxID=1121424 RepID=A0A1I2QHP8_9FIRM|nr:hypothetical protein [Desulfotruncus arcticus]SFG25747.1 hypothetical protein SAMN05660649_01169 [Desulfotomaculum arcticum] [Desulfotruncus arcticus DSM 17038]